MFISNINAENIGLNYIKQVKADVASFNVLSKLIKSLPAHGHSR